MPEDVPVESTNLGRSGEAVAGFIQYTHPEKVYSYLPGMDEANIAGLYGVDVATYQGIKQRFAAAARGAALALLDEPEFAARVDRMPFAPGATVVAIGDSFTDDAQSWLAILEHLLVIRRPQDEIRIINAAVSARTSSEALHYSVMVLGEQPDWVLCLLGGADAKRVGSAPAKPLVSIEETAANLAELRRFIVAQSGASWVWLTPGLADEATVAAYPPFQRGQSRWTNADLLAVGDVIRCQPEPVVDLQAIFGDPPDVGFLSPDGLHPSLAGQQAIARAVVERLTR
jgi:lysophospholipase L1-like esterase